MPARRAADGPFGHGQDAPRGGRRWRGGRALPLLLGVGLRRGPRGARRSARSGPLRPGAQGRAVHCVHRRSRRHCENARPLRPKRRARADVEPAALRARRLQLQGGGRPTRRPHRRHESARVPRRGAGAAGPPRQDCDRAAPRRQRPLRHPPAAREAADAGRGRRLGRRLGRVPPLLWGRHGQRCQRSGAARASRQRDKSWTEAFRSRHPEAQPSARARDAAALARRRTRRTAAAVQIYPPPGESHHTSGRGRRAAARACLDLM
mmetsp:Transcript_10389/g.34390  ORF Transcript_10389/g.34390 Transcript_10389/m.34390 type:complete len:264 (-) Transcript_10389:18-809(-)